MPTTAFKNILYRALLPFCAPKCPKDPVCRTEGHPLIRPGEYVHLLRKHHILGSAAIISSGQDSALICSDSEEPCHHADPDTFFRVASITKMATAAVTMRLAEQKILELDEPVSTWLSFEQSEELLRGITLRRLLSHTSGLTDPPALERDLEKGVVLPEVLRNIPGREERLNEFHYSNLGFGMIGCVMESAMGQPVSRIFEEELFIPLGMRSTLEGCALPADRIMPVTRVLPWKKDQDLILTSLGKRPLKEPDPLRHFGHTAGSMYTDVRSLFTLLNQLKEDGEDSFLSRFSREEIRKQHASYGKLSPALSYGLGLLRIRDSRLSDGVIYGHQGFAYGCADGAFWEETTGRTLIMLNGGCSEARNGRLGKANEDLMHWAFRKELPAW